MSKIILGSRGKYFRGAGEDLGIIFREQGSTDPTGGGEGGSKMCGCCSNYKKY